MKRLMALILTIALSVTLMSALAVSASAEEMFNRNVNFWTRDYRNPSSIGAEELGEGEKAGWKSESEMLVMESWSGPNWRSNFHIFGTIYVLDFPDDTTAAQLRVTTWDNPFDLKISKDNGSTWQSLISEKSISGVIDLTISLTKYLKENPYKTLLIRASGEAVMNPDSPDYPSTSGTNFRGFNVDYYSESDLGMNVYSRGIKTAGVETGITDPQGKLKDIIIEKSNFASVANGWQAQSSIDNNSFDVTKALVFKYQLPQGAKKALFGLNGQPIGETAVFVSRDGVNFSKVKDYPGAFYYLDAIDVSSGIADDGTVYVAVTNSWVFGAGVAVIQHKNESGYSLESRQTTVTVGSAEENNFIVYNTSELDSGVRKPGATLYKYDFPKDAVNASVTYDVFNSNGSYTISVSKDGKSFTEARTGTAGAAASNVSIPLDSYLVDNTNGIVYVKVENVSFSKMLIAFDSKSTSMENAPFSNALPLLNGLAFDAVAGEAVVRDIDILDYDDQQIITYILTQAPQHGAVTFDNTSHQMVYTPKADAPTGTDTFKFIAFDGIAYSEEATITISITGTASGATASNTSTGKNPKTSDAGSVIAVLGLVAGASAAFAVRKKIR